jgi:hypothetical protein
VKPLILALAATALAAPVAAKPNGNNNGTGWGVGKIPPGHCKKIESCRTDRDTVVYERADDITRDTPEVQVINNYTVIEYPGLFDLPALPADQLYVRRENEIYRIMRDTAVVVEALGIVSEVLN